MLFDRQGRCLRANRTGLTMMRVSEQEMIGREFRDLWPQDIRPQVDEAVRKVLAGAECAFDAYRLHDGHKSWWSVIVAPIVDSDGAVTKFISIATDSTYRKKAEEERVAFYEQRIEMERKHAREKEQLLMELHDGIGGIAVNISVLAAMGQKGNDIEAAKRTLASIAQLSHDGIAEVRSFMNSLDPNELKWRSLGAELNHQGRNMLEPHSIAFKFTSSIEEADQGPGSLFWVNLVKIYREALTNIIKHSKADTVLADLTVDQHGLRLTIQDNGDGWRDPTGSGRGLANMRKRAAAIGGQVNLSTTKGVLIELVVPEPGTPVSSL